MSNGGDVSDEVESSVPSSKKPKTSVVWEFFEKYLDENGQPRARCLNCATTYAAKNTSGTSNLKSHLLKCVEGGDVSSYPPLDQEKYREKIAQVIVKNSYPFAFVEHDGIEDLHCFLHPHVKGISRNTAKSDVLKLYRKEKENLKCYLRSIPGKICLTSDLWSSINTDQYMVLTAHFVNRRWELEKKVLAFFHFPPPHTGVNLAEKLLSLLRGWGIEKKIFTITLDNASNNDAMVNILKRHPSFGPSLIVDGLYFHVRCGAHVLNLIVHEGIKAVGASLDKIRVCVKYIRGSEARKMKFASCLEQLTQVTSKQLRQDMPIRWNSSYLMLDSAIGLREAFTLLQDIDPHFDNLSDEEWIEAQKIAEFLKPFYDITTLFSGTTYPTANLYFSGVWRIQMKIKEVACVFHSEFENQDQVCCMAKRMKVKFDKYWTSYSVILSFAVILDPRFKLQFVEYCYGKLFGSDGEKLANDILDKLKAFFQEYLKSSKEISGSSSQSSVRGSPQITSSDFADFGKFQSKLCGPSRKESDLQSYLDEPKLDHKKYEDLDILEYWKANEGKYPEVAMMARDVLSIPITTVASESSFSIGGRILDKYRSTLLPDNVEALLCTHDWLCGTPG
jgi:hypothetical protein